MTTKLYPPPPALPPLEDAGLLPYDSKEFGLTYDEYQILVEDYEQAIGEANKKYGFGGAGYLAEDGNYYLPNEDDTSKYVDHTQTRRQNRNRPKRLSTEEVAIAKGIIKISDPIDEKEEDQ
jgi:hypothetical protein